MPSGLIAPARPAPNCCLGCERLPSVNGNLKPAKSSIFLVGSALRFFGAVLFV
jgi:hypothetical protein